MSASTSRLGRFLDLPVNSGLPVALFLRLSPLLGVFGLGLSGTALLVAKVVADDEEEEVAMDGVVAATPAAAAVASCCSEPRLGRLLFGWSLACLLRVRMRDGDSSPSSSRPAVVEPVAANVTVGLVRILKVTLDLRLFVALESLSHSLASSSVSELLSSFEIGDGRASCTI